MESAFRSQTGEKNIIAISLKNKNTILKKKNFNGQELLHKKIQ